MFLEGKEKETRCPLFFPSVSEKKVPPNYAQRQAVLWALRELTGRDAGDRSADWYWALLTWDFGPDS